MHPEEIFDDLEELVNELPFDLPHHEDGGHVYPFAWNASERGKFNILNLCKYNKWIKSSDVDAVIKKWQELAYVREFNGGSLDRLEIGDWPVGLKSLELAIDTLNNLQAYEFRLESDYWHQDGIIIGQTNDGIWLGITSNVYVSTGYIPKDRIDCLPIESLPLKIEIDNPNVAIEIEKSTATPLMPKAPQNTNKNKKYTNILGATHIISQIERITFDVLKPIFINADFADYGRSHNYKIVFGVGNSLESAWNQTLQASGILEISKFKRLYTRNDDLIYNYYCDYEEEEVDDIFSRYQKITALLNEELSQPIVYRLSSGISENIYIIGDVDDLNDNEGDKLGIYIKSNFVYNP